MARIPNYQKQQSDVIVDLMKRYGFKYAALNPGASFRGLHDSIINYGENQPQMLVCQHEKIAVQIAHGYARATGEPMIAIVHDVVGLLHSDLGIYYAFVDRAPVFVIGATGPMDETKRRPRTDWQHTAQVQGNAVRHYTKYDYQPATVAGVVDSFMRAYSTMMTEPCGPIYLCYDAMLQETPLTAEVTMPPADAMLVPAPSAADPAALEPIVDALLTAEMPWIFAQHTGRQPGNFEKLVDLAEAVGAAVWDLNNALCFPNRHPLALSMDKKSLAGADAVLTLDVREWEKETTRLDSTTRELVSILSDDCRWMDVGFHEIGISSWSLDHGRYLPKRDSVLGDPRLAMPQMTEIARRRLADDARLAARVAARKEKIGKLHDAAFARWAKEAEEDRDASPVTIARLAQEVWEVIKDEDWVCTTGTLREWARKLWNFDKPYRHAGEMMGTATQIGMSLGVALAHKGTGRLPVALQPDGDLMFDVGALWTAAKHRIPILIVMFNNRAYYNDWHHQIRMANLRGTDLDKAHIGMDLFDPEPDFGAAARAMGMWGEGPITEPGDIGPALKRAIAVVKDGKPALVDVVTRHR